MQFWIRGGGGKVRSNYFLSNAEIGSYIPTKCWGQILEPAAPPPPSSDLGFVVIELAYISHDQALPTTN